jgi:dUTP pyrophosphatase
MEKKGVKVKRLHEYAKIPSYGSSESAGFDIYAIADEIAKPGEVKMIPTGLSFEIPEGTHLQVWDRSSLGKKGIHMYGGIIDSDYRGEFHFLLYNSTSEDFEIKKGDRVCQVLLLPVFRAEFKEVSNLEDTDRGEGGFGSTGR